MFKAVIKFVPPQPIRRFSPPRLAITAVPFPQSTMCSLVSFLSDKENAVNTTAANITHAVHAEAGLALPNFTVKTAKVIKTRKAHINISAPLSLSDSLKSSTEAIDFAKSQINSAIMPPKNPGKFMKENGTKPRAAPSAQRTMHACAAGTATIFAAKTIGLKLP